MKHKHKKIWIALIVMLLSTLSRADEFPPLITNDGVYFAYPLNRDTLLINNPNGSSTLCTGVGSLILCQ